MIDNEMGKLFPPAITSIGYIFLTVGILVVVLSPLIDLEAVSIGLALALSGSIIACLKTGIQIDPDKRRFREYTGLWQLKVGDWKGIESFTDISVLRKRITTTAFSRANRPAKTSDKVVFDVCLLDKSHRRKQIIHRFNAKDESTKSAIQIANTLGLKFTMYSLLRLVPQLSPEDDNKTNYNNSP